MWTLRYSIEDDNDHTSRILLHTLNDSHQRITNVTEMPEDILQYIFGFVEDDNLLLMKSVCKKFETYAKISVLTGLIITSWVIDNTYLLKFNPAMFKNLKVLICPSSDLTEIPHIVGLERLICHDNQLYEISFTGEFDYSFIYNADFL